MPRSIASEPNYRILVVDENEAIHASFRQILISSETVPDSHEDGATTAVVTRPRTRGFALDSARHCEEALQLVQTSIDAERPYAMAFVDVPSGTNCVETIERLQKHDSELQIVICTANSDFTWSEIIGRLGDSHELLILKKPFDSMEVIQLAHAMTDKWNATRRDALAQQILDESYQDLKNLHRDLQETQSQLVHSEKLASVGQLAAGVAHEINTPIQYVGDNVQFLQDSFRELSTLLDCYRKLESAVRDGRDAVALLDDVDAAVQAADLEFLQEEIPDSITQTLEGIDRVTTIVAAMKQFSHPGSEERQAANLNEAIQSTLTVSRNEWKYVADLVTDFDPSLPLVPCHVHELNQALLNLIVNASHAITDRNPDGTQGTLTISTRRVDEPLSQVAGVSELFDDNSAQQGHVEIRVSDTGTGIPDDVRTKVFDPFFTTKDVGRGTGQGLTVVYSVVVERHGGSIDIESEVGQGTTFILRLPL